MAIFTGSFKGHRYGVVYERSGNDVNWGAVIEGVGASVHTHKGTLTEAVPVDHVCEALIREQVQGYIDGFARS